MTVAESRQIVSGNLRTGKTEYVPGHSMQLANAHLIAAAPELLAALKNLLTRAQQELKQDSTHDGLTNCDALAAARRAITKATGEEWTYPPKAKETT